jgi:hypothetical protein
VERIGEYGDAVALAMTGIDGDEIRAQNDSNSAGVAHVANGRARYVERNDPAGFSSPDGGEAVGGPGDRLFERIELATSSAGCRRQHALIFAGRAR